MTEFEILRKVEIPLAIPTILPASAAPRSRSSRRRRSRRWPGSLTLGDFIINENVYGENGVLAGAIVVALLALTLEFALAGLQRLLTSQGPEAEAPRDFVQPNTRRHQVRINDDEAADGAGDAARRSP